LDAYWWQRLLLLSALVLLLGLWDDRWNIRPHFKLAGQLTIGTVAYVCGLRMDGLLGISLPVWLNWIVTVGWFVAMMNAFNLIDGMDGLATGLGAIAAAGMAGAFMIMGLPGNALVMLGLLGACLAFLRFNFHPARIFLGDTGSLFIGFVLAATALSSHAKEVTLVIIAVPLLAVGIPLFDTVLAIWRRLGRRILHRLSPRGQGEGTGQKLFGADLEHLHHRLLAAGFSQKKAALFLYAGAVVLVVTGLLAMLYREKALGLYSVVLCAAVYIAVRHVAYIELWNSSLAVARGLIRLQLRHLTVPIYIAVDLTILLVAFAGARLLFMPHPTHEAVRQLMLHDAIIGVGLPFLCLVAGRTYWRVWSMAQTIDHLHLALCLLAGIVLSFGVTQVVAELEIDKLVAVSVVYFACALVALCGVRILPRVFAEYAVYLGRRYNPEKRELQQVLVYGAWGQGRSFLQSELERAMRNDRCHAIIGFLDEDPNLHGRLVCGYRVLGGMAALENILKQNRVDCLILTVELTGPALVTLNRLLAIYPLTPLVWRTTLLPFDGGVMSLPILPESPSWTCLKQPGQPALVTRSPRTNPARPRRWRRSEFGNWNSEIQVP
jgi:UDP-N-acetylmuramyl pentapeptide phosphotransferase/UDP-N-acetylglucosamine-1-phosphate transferase